VQRELPASPYRSAIVHPLMEAVPADMVAEVDGYRSEVVDILHSLGERIGGRFPSALDLGLAREISLAELVNTIASELDIPVENKLDLLARNLPERASRILSILRSRQRVLDLLEPFRRASVDPDSN